MIRVLVVDDEALIRTGFQRILAAAEGIEVVGAVSGGQALRTVREQRPDVVLLDIRMPDVDGLTLLGEIRRLPEPPVVAMLTTFDMDEYVETALRSGAAGFLLRTPTPRRCRWRSRAWSAAARCCRRRSPAPWWTAIERRTAGPPAQAPSNG